MVISEHLLTGMCHLGYLKMPQKDLVGEDDPGVIFSSAVHVFLIKYNLKTGLLARVEWQRVPQLE